MLRRVTLIVLALLATTLLYFYSITEPVSAIDVSTQANIDQIKTKHIHLDWNVDFENQNLNGDAVLDLVTLVDNVDEIILDTKYLDIKSVSFGDKKLKVTIAFL